MALTEEQAANAALGVSTRSGMTGADIDSLVHTEPLAPGATPIPSSLLVAAWAQSARSPASRLALRYLGDQNFADHSAIVFPSAVLTLFAADTTANPDIPPPEGGPPSFGGPATAAPRPPARPQTAAPQRPAQLLDRPLTPAAGDSLCEQFKSFVFGTIDRVFSAVGRFETVGYSGNWFDDIIPFIRNVAATIGNLALDSIKFVIANGVRLAIGPITNAIAAVTSVLAVASTIVTTLQPWKGSLSTDPSPVRRSVTGNPGVVHLVVTGGLSDDDWPSEIVGCARAADVDLPSLKPRDADVTWTLGPQLPAPMLDKTSDSGPLSSDSTATMQFTTIAETPEVAKGKEQNDGQVFVNVAVHRRDLDKLQRMLSGTVLSLVPDVVNRVFGPQLRSLIDPQFKAMLEPIAALRDVTIPENIAVTYHVAREPDSAPDAPRPNDPSGPGRVPTACPPASVIGTGFSTNAAGEAVTWERQDVDMSVITSLGKLIGIDAGIPQVPGALACLYEDPEAALPRIIPGLPLSRTTAIVGVLPTEKPMTDGAREVHMSGVKRAWFQQTLLWVVVDGWTLSVPSVSGSADREKSALDIAQAVIAWSR